MRYDNGKSATMTPNGGEDEIEEEIEETESQSSSDISPHSFLQLTSKGISSQSLLCGLCGICNKDLISEPNSIQCDVPSCKKLFHPKCLGNFGPFDSEPWACIDCQNHLDQSIDQASVENSNCPVCSIDVGKLDQGLQCDRCDVWFHCDCVGVSKAEYEVLADSKDDWFCVGCKAIRANNIKWGSMIGEDTVRSVIKGIYMMKSLL